MEAPKCAHTGHDAEKSHADWHPWLLQKGCFVHSVASWILMRLMFSRFRFYVCLLVYPCKSDRLFFTRFWCCMDLLNDVKSDSCGYFTNNPPTWSNKIIASSKIDFCKRCRSRLVQLNMEYFISMKTYTVWFPLDTILIVWPCLKHEFGSGRIRSNDIRFDTWGVRTVSKTSVMSISSSVAWHHTIPCYDKTIYLRNWRSYMSSPEAKCRKKERKKWWCATTLLYSISRMHDDCCEPDDDIIRKQDHVYYMHK